MDEKILVAYASTHGATEEIARAIADTLRERGVPTDLQPAKSVRALDGYGAVVFGAPLYIMRLHADAKRFLARHQKALQTGLPVAIFAGGPFGDANESVWQEVRKELDNELKQFPWLAPVAVQVVGGKFDPMHLRFPYNLIPALKGQPYSDLRDWEAIRAWAGELPARFQSVATPESVR